MGWQDAPIVEDKPRPSGPQERWRAAPIASVGDDIAATVPSAVSRVPFVAAGLVGDALGLGMETGRWIDENILGNPVKSREEVAAANPLANITSGALEDAYTEKMGVAPFYNPETDAGKIVGPTITGAVLGSLGGPRGAVMGAGGGAGGELARQKTEGTKWELPASVLGAIGGSAAGGTATAIPRRIVTPRNIPRENARAANVLRREGVGNLTEGQVTQSKRLQAAERQRMGVRGDARRVEQLEALTSAALRRAGINSRRATQEVMDRAFDDFNTQYRTLSARNTLAPDREFADDLRAAADDYAGRVNEPNRMPMIGNYMREMGEALRAGNGAISGEAYQSLRSRIQASARSTVGTDPAKQTLFDLAEALDSAMERSIGRTNPGDLGAFRDVRRRYRNILVVEDAITTGGPDAALGLITPGPLQSATKRVQGRRNLARGNGDFQELARAASGIMTELPLTGAAPFSPDSLFGAVKSGVGLARMAAPVQRYLTNRLLPPPPGNPMTRALLPAVPGMNMATQGPYRTGGGF